MALAYAPDIEEMFANIVTEVRWITPPDARFYLTKNTCNRPLVERHVDHYAKMMRAGEFDFPNGETLIFGDDDTLMDGQHRLAAVVRTGLTLPFIVVTGIPSDRRAFIDTGVKRTLSHALAMRGEKDVTSLSAALYWLNSYEHNSLATQGNRLRFVSHQQGLAYLDTHPQLREAVTPGRRMQPLLVPGVGVFLYYLFARIDQTLADKFTTGIHEGCFTKESCQPLWFLRERLIREEKSNRSVSHVAKIVYCFKTWNALRTGKALLMLRWLESETVTEDIPLLL
jgi:hypothetical protein